VFRKNIKRFIYLLILTVPFFIVFFRPSFLNLTVVMDHMASTIAFVQWPLKEAEKVIFYRRAYEDNRRLRKEVDGLKARLAGVEEIIKENSRYERVLQFRRDLIFSSVVAGVVGRDPSHWNSSLMIDKGRGDGVRPGMPVVTPSGIVGKIAEAGNSSSKVILVSDPDFSVAAVVQRSRESGLVTGTLQGLCRVQYLSPHADIKRGDKMISSKMSSFFPEGLVIGEVISVQGKRDDPAMECLLKPAVNTSQLEEVIVIKQ
jgi:rod shape-determining protein MreC